MNAFAELVADAVAAAWSACGQVVHYLVRDKGYAVAASSGAEHELDYYTEPCYWWDDVQRTARLRRWRWEDR